LHIIKIQQVIITWYLYIQVSIIKLVKERVNEKEKETLDHVGNQR